MNWYKTAQKLNIQFVSHNSLGDMKVYINGKPYVYYDVSPFWAEKIRWMIGNVPHGKVMEKLKEFSNNKEYQKRKFAPPLTKEEQDQILDELYERGLM
jgi:hypothetical protein